MLHNLRGKATSPNRIKKLIEDTNVFIDAIERMENCFPHERFIIPYKYSFRRSWITARIEVAVTYVPLDQDEPFQGYTVVSDV